MVHEHTNPSPSHVIAAWCNGNALDRGCGGPVPLYEFRAHNQHSYLIDGRDFASILRALEEFDFAATARLWNPAAIEQLRTILNKLYTQLAI